MMTGGIFAFSSVAAPTVKKLGGTTTNDATGDITKQTITKLSTTNQRSPSVRTLSLSNPKTSTSTSATKASNSANSSRLPGLHSNIIKSIGSKLSANNASQSNNGNKSDLAQRVTDLEAEMVTKQEILEPGNGINIDKNTISLAQDITSLPEKLDTITQEIDDLDKKIEEAGLSGEYYTKEQTEEYVSDNYYNKEYLDAILSQLSAANIAKDFDPKIFDPNYKVQP